MSSPGPRSVEANPAAWLTPKVAPRRGSPRGRRPGWRPGGDTWIAWALIAPALGCVVVWTYVPGLLSGVASFFKIPLSGESWEFVGFGNYTAVAHDAEAQQAAWNTLLYCAFMILPSIAIGLGFALLVTSLSRGSTLVSVVLFLPMTANLVAMAVVFQWIFAFNGGFVNSLLAIAGIGPVNFLGDGRTALPTVAAVGVWRAASFCMVLFLAGLTTIPTSMHEAAAMDGLRGWSKFWNVTLPLLRPIVVLTAVVATLIAVQSFDTIRVMTDGGPRGATESMLTLTWKVGFEFFQLGAASALSAILLVALLALGVLRRRAILRGAA